MVFDGLLGSLVLTLEKNLLAKLSGLQSRPDHSGFVRTVLIFATLVATQVSLAEEAAIELKTANQPGTLTRVHAVVEVNGELKLNPDGKKVTKLALKGKGE